MPQIFYTSKTRNYDAAKNKCFTVNETRTYGAWSVDLRDGHKQIVVNAGQQMGSIRRTHLQYNSTTNAVRTGGAEIKQTLNFRNL